jgi:general secretion pathway protein G
MVYRTNLCFFTALRRNAGFTLLELMIVVTIIGILLAAAIPNYQHSMQISREAVLKQDLKTMREQIQSYTLDKQAGPQSLDDLVSAGYMREIPTDPITHAKDWHADFDDVLLSPDQTAPGVSDVHSSSTAPSSDGSVYNTW